MTITINGSTGITTPEITLDNTAADGGQVVLKSSGYSNWNLDNYSGRLRGYYGSTEYWTVTASGNVGIGTNSPSYKLDVSSGSSRVGDTTQGFIQLGASATASQNSHIGAVTSDSSLRFYNGNFGAGTERMRIDSSGNLLVNQTTQIATGVISIGTYRNGGAVTGITTKPSTNVNYDFASFYNSSGTYVGYISCTSSATAYSTSSDYRLKDNVQPMTGALEKIAQLKPCTYTWKIDGSNGQGFIAHELQEVVPDCVRGEKDAVNEDGSIKAQGIDTSFLVATLTAAIQEQQAIIESLKTRIETLENK